MRLEELLKRKGEEDELDKQVVFIPGNKIVGNTETIGRVEDGEIWDKERSETSEGGFIFERIDQQGVDGPMFLVKSEETETESEEPLERYEDSNVGKKEEHREEEHLEEELAKRDGGSKEEAGV